MAREGRILVTGYNGAPAGMAHCDHTDDPHPCDVAVHAEANCIAWAAREGIPLEGAEMFTTHTPCVACAKLIINAGIVRVVADMLYRDPAGGLLLKEAGVLLEQF